MTQRAHLLIRNFIAKRYRGEQLVVLSVLFLILSAKHRIMTPKVLIKFTIAFMILCICAIIVECGRCDEVIVGFEKIGVHRK